MNTGINIPGRQTFTSSPASSKSSQRQSSNGSNVSLPTIVEVPEDVDTRGDPYVKTGFRGVLGSPYCTKLAVLAALGGLAFGYNEGIIPLAFTMKQCSDQFPQLGIPFWYYFVLAISQLGGFLGALIMGSAADRCSRRNSMGLAAVVFIVGFAFQTVSMNYAMLVVARLISAIAVGMLSVISPIYISEISPPEIRGALLIFMDLAIVIGSIVSFGITFGTRYIDGEESWRLPFVLLVVPGAVLGIGAISLPYSPRWLALRFENQQALFYLAKIRQLSADDCKVQNEWMEIHVDAAYQREISETQHPRLQQRPHINGIKLELAMWLDCFRSRYWKRTHLSIGLMFFQQFAGVNALAYNFPALMGTLGAGFNVQVALPVILGSVHFLGALSCLWTIDTVGRKRLLVYGSSVMLVCLVIIAGLNGQFSYDWASHQDAAWICVGFSILCSLAFGATWSPISWALPAEIFPSRLRAKGSALSACSYWLNAFLAKLVTQSLFNKSEWGIYAFFAGLCLLSGFWVALFVPETKCRILEEMDRLFQSHAEFIREEEKKKDIRKTLASGYDPEPFISPGGTPTNGFRTRSVVTIG